MQNDKATMVAAESNCKVKITRNWNKINQMLQLSGNSIGLVGQQIGNSHRKRKNSMRINWLLYGSNGAFNVTANSKVVSKGNREEKQQYTHLYCKHTGISIGNMNSTVATAGNG